ncbi:MAG TPA: STAS domain-containing protein [Patescibacteria group bacterium]|nr:STAS domain-containing protein [Patescibacteria group bacterium]
MEIKLIGNVRVAVFPPRVEAAAAEEIKEALLTIVATGGQKILCDFSRTEVVAPAGLKAIVAALHRIHQAGGQMAFSMMKPDVRELFNEAGLSQIFRYYDDEEALKVTVLKELAAHFAHYTDLHGVLLQRYGEKLTVEIYLEFDKNQLMGQVQKHLDTIRAALTEKLAVDRVLIIPAAQPVEGA